MPKSEADDREWLNITTSNKLDEVYKASWNILHVRHTQSTDIWENIYDVDILTLHIRIFLYADTPLSEGRGKAYAFIN